MEAWKPLRIVINVEPPTMEFMNELYLLDLFLLEVIQGGK